MRYGHKDILRNKCNLLQAPRVRIYYGPVLGVYDLEVFDFELFAYDETTEVRKRKDQRVFGKPLTRTTIAM